jgi:protein-export membrane protein SecD
VWLVLITFMTAFSVWASLPNNPGIRVDFNGDGTYEIDKPIVIRQGLDLAGGLKVLLQADVPPDTSLPRSSMEEVRRIVENRIDALGALEPVVQLQGDRRVIIEIPGYEDPESAVSLVRQTALLEFVDFGSNPLPAGTAVKTDYITGSGTGSTQTATPEATPTEGAAAQPEVPVGPTYHTVFAGDILQTADVGLDNQTTNPLVTFVLTPEGSTLFADYTTSHTGQYLGIVLDGVVLSSPRIQQPITGGTGSITGSFTLEEATQLATQLRYGALPVPLRVESTSTVGPTLGQISVDQSIRAGIIGVVVVLIFMLVYYRIPGIAAALALIIFALFNLTIYKLVPVTMTLPAITGFLISVGTAVDGNILIFERMKEELRHGRRLGQAVDAGFDRAWTSIRDSNFSTIIICTVLYAFGTSFGAGAVRGFAVTLALGLIINLFTAVTVTRTFLHFIMLPLSDGFAASNRWLLGLSREA